MDNAYITLENLDRFRKNLRRSTAGQGTGARVLHNRMISYYSQPGEVYSVVKRMRIPRVKAGDSFCLKGIVEDGTTAEYMLENTEVIVGRRIYNPCLPGREVIHGESQRPDSIRFLDYDEESQMLTVKDGINETLEGEEVNGTPTVTLLIPTRLHQNTHDSSLTFKAHGGFSKERKLVWMNEDCVRPVNEIGIDGNLFHLPFTPAYVSPAGIDRLKDKGVEIEILRCASHRPISPRKVEGSSSTHDANRHPHFIKSAIEDEAGRSLMDIDIKHYSGVYSEYVVHLQRWYKRKLQWRWLKCNAWPVTNAHNRRRFYFVRLRRHRGKEVSQWRVYRLTAFGAYYCSKEPACVRLGL